MATTTTPSVSQPPERPTISDVVDSLGYGWAQVKAVTLGCSVYFADGCELLVISSVTNVVSDDWDLTRFQRSSVVTLVFVGIFLGNFASGPLGDAAGRQRIIVISYYSIFLFSVASSYAWGFWSLALSRLVAGFSFGLGQPVGNALGSEITPTKWRVVNSFWLNVLFLAGEVYVAIFILYDDPSMHNIHWRYLVRCGALPALVLAALSTVLLIESPMWLATQGRGEEARKTLRCMAIDNGLPNLDVDFKQQTAGTASRLQDAELFGKVLQVFGPKYGWSTLVTIFGVFVANLSYYGGLYAFSQVLPALDTGVSPAVQILFGALWELPGSVLGLILCLWMPRIPVMVSTSCFMAVFLVVFGVGVDADSPVLENMGFYGCKVTGIPTFVVYYVYSTEIFPTKIRSTGAAIILAAGRIAGMVAPFVFEGAEAALSTASFFYMIGVLSAANALLALTLPFETYAAQLIEHDDVGEKTDEGTPPTPEYGTLA